MSLPLGRFENTIEITTTIGCPNMCLKYCPQEIIVKKYEEKYGTSLTMSMDVYEKILANCPPSVTFIFAGFSEPFTNPNCAKMIKMASEQGHKIDLFTTLYGMTGNDVKELSKLTFNKLVVHLPDGKVMKEPSTTGYRDRFFELQTSIPNISFTSMNAHFRTNNRENVSRNKVQKRRSFGYCAKFSNTFMPIALPNGMAHLCCMDYSLRNPVGNLLEEDYITIRNRTLNRKGEFFECQYCDWNKPYFEHFIGGTLNRVHRNLNKLLLKQEPISWWHRCNKKQGFKAYIWAGSLSVPTLQTWIFLTENELCQFEKYGKR